MWQALKFKARKLFKLKNLLSRKIVIPTEIRIKFNKFQSFKGEKRAFLSYNEGPNIERREDEANLPAL